MTTDEWFTLYGLRAVSQHEPTTAGTVQAAMRQMTEGSGLVPAEKVDAVMVLRLLAASQKAEPPLVACDYAPGDTDHLGRVRPGAERLWELTEAGDVELDRLERLAGVV